MIKIKQRKHKIIFEFKIKKFFKFFKRKRLRKVRYILTLASVSAVCIYLELGTGCDLRLFLVIIALLLRGK